MKKQLLIISIIVVIVSIFVSCSANSSSEDVSTTAVTDSNGATHYYGPVTDDKGNVSTTDKNQGVFAELETKLNGKAVIDKNGTYVTKEHTTVLPIKDEIIQPSTSTEPTAEKQPSGTVNNNADNDVDFESDKPTEETKPTASTTTEKPTTTTTTETTTQKESQPATDKDGWITKWY